ncbi:MAG: M3 family oligoendopeptidase [Alphaproteobacteria bacterium]|nr:M3 family oligoendopeptidase [Alphaproteobacteria bacterium]
MSSRSAAEAPPRWDLSDLYAGPDAAELKKDLAAAREGVAAFAKAHQGRIASMAEDAAGGGRLADAIAEYERLEETIGRIGSYAGLLHAANTSDPKVAKIYGDLQAQLSDITAPLLFFQLELNGLDEARLEALMAEPRLRRYAPWLKDVRDFKPYQLNEEIERAFFEKDLTGRAAWVRLYDETLAGLRFSVGGEQVPLEEALNSLSDENRATRERAAGALAEGFKPALPVFTTVLNTLAKDKEIDDRWRGIADPALSRHVANHVEPEVVAALVAAVREAFPRLSHRYYAMKAKWLGLGKLEYWDRNAPLPFTADRKFAWGEARDLVLDAYDGFSPDLGRLARRFFEEPWIDAEARPGKASGAFSHPTVPSAHPYILLNFKGKTRDVMTIAHELGHGVHQLLSAPQGALMAGAPLTLAETASVFGEMLAFRRLLDTAKSADERRALLAGKVEDMLNTVVRQIAFYRFESEVHRQRKEGELTADDVARIWLDVQTESLGPAFAFADGYERYWCYISHFFHAPFYVYAYAFGDGLVNALYARYREAESGFVGRYLDLLKAGGSKRHKELLAPFGLDATDPGFWAMGLSVIEGLIDELEAGGGA